MARTREAIIRAALVSVGKKYDYEVLCKNCESFACWCTTGQYYTSQGKQYGFAVRNACLIVLTVLMAQGAPMWQSILEVVLAASTTWLVTYAHGRIAQGLLISEAVNINII